MNDDIARACSRSIRSRVMLCKATFLKTRYLIRAVRNQVTTLNRRREKILNDAKEAHERNVSKAESLTAGVNDAQFEIALYNILRVSSSRLNVLWDVYSKWTVHAPNQGPRRAHFLAASIIPPRGRDQNNPNYLQTFYNSTDALRDELLARELHDHSVVDLLTYLEEDLSAADDRAVDGLETVLLQRLATDRGLQKLEAALEDQRPGFGHIQRALQRMKEALTNDKLNSVLVNAAAELRGLLERNFHTDSSLSISNLETWLQHMPPAKDRDRERPFAEVLETILRENHLIKLDKNALRSLENAVRPDEDINTKIHSGQDKLLNALYAQLDGEPTLQAMLVILKAGAVKGHSFSELPDMPQLVRQYDQDIIKGLANSVSASDVLEKAEQWHEWTVKMASGREGISMSPAFVMPRNLHSARTVWQSAVETLEDAEDAGGLEGLYENNLDDDVKFAIDSVLVFSALHELSKRMIVGFDGDDD